MGGSAPLLPLLWLSMDLLDQRLQLLARVESDHPACGDGNFLAGLRVAARAMRISSKNVSTMSFASRLLSPTFSNSISASSALVSVIIRSLGTQSRAEFRRER